MRKSQSRERILVVDDDPDIRLALEMSLNYHGYEVLVAKDGEEALARLKKEQEAGAPAAMVLTDLKMPRLDGMGLVERLSGSGLPVVVVSGHGDVATAVEAVRKGAVNFLEKPLDEQRVLVTVRAALRERRLAEENRRLKTRLAGAPDFVGGSSAMARLAAQVAQAARSESSVLIRGENGTGKEVVARALHAGSPRAEGPFVVVNCAAIPDELVESELYGHEKGAYTGAHERRIGHFEAAEGGTLFLDEIGDMPLAAQPKLLRALEQREIVRVGGTQPVKVDLRVLAATNADLEAAVRAGQFRMDLYYRLAVVPLFVPPLRERKEDLPALARHFLAQVAARDGRLPQALSAEATSLLAEEEWPGNVRQLKNLLEAAVVLCDEPEIGRAQLEELLAPARAGRASARPGSHADGAEQAFAAETFEEFKDRSERLYLARKLAENEGNVKRTAERLGMQRSHLYKKIERHGLR
jgi:two-component system nitrogen regulation response regulator NtrX